MIKSKKMTWDNREWPVIDSFIDKNGITNRVLVKHYGNRSQKRAFAMDMLRKSTHLVNAKAKATKKVRLARKVLNAIQKFSRSVNRVKNTFASFQYGF